MTDAWSSSNLETGLRDDFDATIVNSYFGYDSRYNNGETMLLKWEVQGLDEEGVAFEETQLITVGKGWETVDGGQSVRHESGKDSRFFNANSHIGLIVKRAVDDLGIGPILAAKGTPKEAKVWNGLSFHFNREAIKYGGGGEVQESTKLMPTKFLGEGGVTAAANTSAPAAAATTTATAASATNEVSATAGAAGETATRLLLEKAARESATHQEFMDKALEIPGVVSNDALLSEIMLPDGFYTQARG